ncbi:MAG TPA: hypothetical protein VGK73_07055 [Polyangiaceae bacterium]
MSLLLEGLHRETPILNVEDTGAPERSPADPAPAHDTRFRELLRGVAKAIDRGEAIMDGAARGAYGGLDPAQLIALQTGIYRYSEAVDLTSKLVDRVAGGVRTIVQAGH